MKLTKKLLAFILTCLMAATLLAACNGNGEPVETTVPPVIQTPETETIPEEPEPEPVGATDQPYWVGTWGTAMYFGDNSGDGGKRSALEVSQTLPGSTLRQIIRTSTAGEKLRLTFSNEYGQEPLILEAVHIAKATENATSNIEAATDTVITFGGETRIEIPAGEKIFSDPVDFRIGALERIAVSIYFGDVPKYLASHIAARGNSYIQEGNAVSEASISGSTNTHWFALCNVDVASDEKAVSIVAFGDSITDGYGVSNEQYTRWVDVLMNNLQENPDTKHISVINMGIGTNTLLSQSNPQAGRNRFARDVLEQPGVGYLVFLIGVNDINNNRDVSDILTAYDEMITSASAQGIKVYGGTIMPQSSDNDDNRLEINAWLRGQYAEGKMYGLADFDELMQDPENPNSMLQAYKNDNLHPGAEGYRVMGEYVYELILNDMNN